MAYIVHISDTHNDTNKTIPECDILIHSGDLSILGEEVEIRRSLHWLSQQPATHKLLVPGNHDTFFDTDHLDGADSSYIEEFIQQAKQDYAIDIISYGYITYTVNYEDILIACCSSQPPFMGWAFNHDAGLRAQHFKNALSINPDILVTHCPPNGILDKSSFGENLHTAKGCPMLKTLIDQHLEREDSKLKLHCFGHIHESSGYLETDSGMKYSNAACRLNTFRINT